MERDDHLEIMQADTAELLRAVPGLGLARILVDNEGDIEARVVKSLGTLDDTTGKRGLAVIVLLPSVESAEPGLPGPVMTVRQEVQVLENVLINRDLKSGTLMRSSQAALRVLNALHLHTVAGVTWHAEKDPVQPLPVKEGHVSHAVRVTMRLGLGAASKPAAVAASWNTETETLSLGCATAGASIHWTKDGTFPRPGAPGANLYTGPVAGLPAGTIVRAAAWAPGLTPGDVTELAIVEH